MVGMKSGTTTSDPEVDFIALPAGEMIGRYEVLAVLGQGGFGITYLARDIQLGREVAIKEYLPISLAIRQDGNTVLPRSTKVAEDFTWGRDRFVAEGRTLATLHRAPGIVRVFDFLEINGTAYIVMEMLHGETLEARLKKQGALDAAALDLVVWTLLGGLEEVHNAGFLHRDIKPANILLDSKGSPTLIDFGASRAAMVGRTVAMTAIFTPGYAAAEQFTSAKQGPWTDIYGLSATLYHAISGTAPPSAFDRMLDDSYESISRRAGPGFSAGLLAGIDAGLAIRASDRPQSIAGWRAILSWTAASGDDVTVLSGQSRPAPAPAALTLRAVTAAAPSAPLQITESPPATVPRSRLPLFAGIAVAVLALAGGGYFALAPGAKPAPTGVALQDLKIEDLERVLAERRKADAAAAEKKRLEEEAQRKAEADAAAKRTADAELADAQLKRQKAEEELAKLKADMETRRQADAGQREQADSVARRNAEEAAQRKAEAEMATLRQAEDDARKKAAAETEAKRQADEALVRAQAERQKAEAEASQKADAEAKQKAESSTKEVAEAEARQKADAEAKRKTEAEAVAAATEKKAAEAVEIGLRLSPPDRQRVQVALTALGFDTRGSDGAFGPRSREMITTWQKTRNQPATGFLNGAQNQALLKEAAPAVTKFDEDQKKIEDDKKKVEEEKKKAEEEAKSRAAAAAAAAPASSPALAAPAPAAGATSTPATVDARWTGQVKCGYWPNPVAVMIPLNNGQGSVTLRGGNRGSVTITINGSRYSGSIAWSPSSNTSKTLSTSFSGTISGNAISASPHARSDFKGGPGPDDVPCTVELARTQ
ncbi:MAG: hypothetical protein EXR12_09140 [Rhodospirillaceae bacterium]|nr:hypothetical protein [Rhodospirillaceae bacterium]